MRGSGRRLCYSEKEGGKVCRYYTDRVMDEEIDWDHNVEGDAEECPVDSVSRDEAVEVLHEMKRGRNPGPSDVSLELVAVS